MQTLLKNAKWLVLLLVGVVLAVLAFVFRGLFTSDGNDVRTVPTIPKPLKDKVDIAHEEALVSKATAKAKADGQKEQLDEVLKVKDGAERRKRLAALLKTL